MASIFEDVWAQTYPKPVLGDVQYHYFLGRIVKHTSDFIPNITENTQWHELSFRFFTNGSKQWHRAHGLPKLSLSAVYAQYGDAAIFGKSYSAFAGLTYSKKLKNSFKRFEQHLNLKFGINYSTTPYNRFTNPTNNAVGSHLNLTAKIDYGYAYQFSEQLHLLLLLSVKHHSNGRVETPNKGLNVMGGQIGLQFKVNDRKPEKHAEMPSSKELNKKHQWVLSIGYGRHELVKEYNGPKYPVYVVGAFAQKRLNHLLMLNYGVEYVYFKSAYHAIIDNAIVLEYPHWHASKISPYVGLDVLYGRFAIAALIGFYPYKPILTAGRFPTKFGFKYYVHSNDEQNNNNFFIAGYLKTHYAVAEYLELSIGCRFDGNRFKK